MEDKIKKILHNYLEHEDYLSEQFYEDEAVIRIIDLLAEVRKELKVTDSRPLEPWEEEFDKKFKLSYLGASPDSCYYEVKAFIRDLLLKQALDKEILLNTILEEKNKEIKALREEIDKLKG